MKKKMANSKFRAITTTISVILVVLMVGLNIASSMFSSVLDSYLGRGKMHILTAEGTENWDSEYYKASTKSIKEAKAESDNISESITDEGIVLLKNNGVLPLSEGTEVTPFGYAYLNPAYSGSGAAATTDADMVTVEQGLSKYFSINKSAINVMNNATATYPGAADGTNALDSDVNSLQAMMDAGESAKIYDYDSSIYNGIENEVKDSVGLVYIKRTGSEGMDKRTEAYDDGTPHYLALTENEKKTIKYAKENCVRTVVILNTANPMELSPIMSGEYEADAILWVGTTGSRGALSTANILVGKVNPSGRLADIYPTDFNKDPTYENFGAYYYTNSTVEDTSTLDFIPGANKGTMQRPYVEYEEGIYIGYRYYETADIMDDNFVYGKLDKNGGVVESGAVAYPFGYGLSYTDFTQEIVNFDASGDEITMTVKVTNIGEVEGKDVVQVYYTSPYTEYDSENKVEKSTTVLQDFDKTDLIQPGESEEVVITFSKEDMASYDTSHINSDGTTGCYLLEAGNYEIDLKENSHDVISSETVTISDTIAYEGSNVRNSEKIAQSVMDDAGNSLGYTHDGREYVAASNQFDSLSEYMSRECVTNLSRSNWTDSFPTAPENGGEEAPQFALDEYALYDTGSFDVNTNPTLGNVDGSLVYSTEEVASNEDNGLSLIDLRGLDYNDEAWNRLLDQIDWKGEKQQIQALLYNAAYQTGELKSVGKPATTDKDGAMGWSVDGASSWASANLVACTWNTDLVYEYGLCIGEEALQSGLTGWYAPAVNLHRSQFGGRVYEYYSEDSVLTGKISTSIISGAGEKGVISYLKHMALNEQETYRSISLSTWATEQTLREIYLKPFEMSIKNAKCNLKYISDNEGTVSTKVIRASTGIMSAQSFIGTTIGFANYEMLNNVLRNEWGFKGAVVTDLYPSSAVTLRDMVIRAGGDLFMNQTGFFATDYNSTTAKNVMRTALHNILYATVNSNTMNNVAPGQTYYYDLSPWKIYLYLGCAIGTIIVIILICWIIFRKKDEEKNPEKYWKKGEKKAMKKAK